MHGAIYGLLFMAIIPPIAITYSCSYITCSMVIIIYIANKIISFTVLYRKHMKRFKIIGWPYTHSIYYFAHKVFCCAKS